MGRDESRARRYTHNIIYDYLIHIPIRFIIIIHLH